MAHDWRLKGPRESAENWKHDSSMCAIPEVVKDQLPSVAQDSPACLILLLDGLPKCGVEFLIIFQDVTFRH